MEAKGILEDTIASLCKKFRTDKYILAMTDSRNWRHSIYPEYKANRKGKISPACLFALREFIVSSDTFRAFQRPLLEADDILGILATSGSRILKEPGERIIVSVDKDMRSIPCVYHCMSDGITMEIPEEDADRWHMYQTLTGDSADGYPGCRGVGPVKASQILEGGHSYEDWWPEVLKAFEKVGMTEEDALVQARIARICRVQDYDFNKKEVKLWDIRSRKATRLS